MNSIRFDRLTRSLGASVSRRRAVASALAMAVGVGAASSAGAARCRGAGVGCTRNAQCCSEVCDTASPTRAGRNRCAAIACLDIGQTGCRVAGKRCCDDYICSGPASGICIFE